MRTPSHAIDAVILRASRKQQTMMWWLILALITIIVVSSCIISMNSYERRTLANQLHGLHNESTELNITWNQLVLELQSHAVLSRIQTLAETKLAMRAPINKEIKVVTIP